MCKAYEMQEFSNSLQNNPELNWNPADWNLLFVLGISLSD